jgi:hypothetical protein
MVGLAAALGSSLAIRALEISYTCTLYDLLVGIAALEIAHALSKSAW